MHVRKQKCVHALSNGYAIKNIKRKNYTLLPNIVLFNHNCSMAKSKSCVICIDDSKRSLTGRLSSCVSTLCKEYPRGWLRQLVQHVFLQVNQIREINVSPNTKIPPWSLKKEHMLQSALTSARCAKDDCQCCRIEIDHFFGALSRL